jgi:hypothetical protein
VRIELYYLLPLCTFAYFVVIRSFLITAKAQLSTLAMAVNLDVPAISHFLGNKGLLVVG